MPGAFTGINCSEAEHTTGTVKPVQVSLVEPVTYPGDGNWDRFSMHWRDKRNARFRKDI
jgi:hypothetical protein